MEYVVVKVILWNAEKKLSSIEMRQLRRGTVNKLTRASIVIAMVENYSSHCGKQMQGSLGLMRRCSMCAVEESRPKKYKGYETGVEAASSDRYLSGSALLNLQSTWNSTGQKISQQCHVMKRERSVWAKM